MKDFTIISYPGPKNDFLLSLTELRSRYMLPIGGRFRVIDFTLRNSFYSEANSTIIFNQIKDDLKDYIELYKLDNEHPNIEVIQDNLQDINTLKEVVLNTETKIFVLYNGDTPSIINFENLIKKFKVTKKKAVLFKLIVNNSASMAHKIIVVRKQFLLSIIEKLLGEGRKAPNVFEMVINSMINHHIHKKEFQALYWPIRNIPEYYSLSQKIIWDSEIFDLLYDKKIIKSQIKAEGYARVDEFGKVTNSFMSDYCYINGEVTNSIIYPGVEIHKNAIIKDSIILPFVKIGEGVRIIRTIIDENINHEEEIQIKERAQIGSEEEMIKNNNFPRAIFNGITFLGKNVKIPENSHIGGACYVAPNLGEEYFLKKKYLYDGLSII